MSDEQSIRDELAAVIKSAIGYEPVLASPGGLQHRTAADRDWLMERISDALTSSTVIRRIQAEAWDRCVGEMPIDLDWKNFYGDNNPYIERGETA